MCVLCINKEALAAAAEAPANVMPGNTILCHMDVASDQFAGQQSLQFDCSRLIMFYCSH